MENYKEKYESALERAKELYNSIFGKNDILEQIFPELIKSEDERISKGIIEYLEQSQFGENHYCIDDDIVRDYIAWLEKQGHTDSIIAKAKTEKQRVIITETDGNAKIDWDTRSLEDTKELLEYGLQYINVVRNKLVKFMSKELDTIVSNARKALFNYIIKVMSKIGVEEITFSKPITFQSWDEDDCYMTVVTGLTLNDKNDIWVKVDYDGSYDEEEIQLFSIDEIIVMASKLTKQ